MLRKLAAVALCAASLSCASERTIAAKYLLASSQRYNVTHDANGILKVNGQRVHDYDLDPSLRKPGSIREFFKNNHSKLEVSRIGNDYAIKRHEQLKGGGPHFGFFMYWATKSICYGAMSIFVGAGTAAVVAASPVALPPAVAGGVAGAVGAAAPVALGSVGAGMVSGAVLTSAAAGSATAVVATQAAVVGTAAIVAETGSVVTAIGAVESFALAVGTLCGMAPTP